MGANRAPGRWSPDGRPDHERATLGDVPTDAETYLRMLGERLVLDRDRQSFHRPGGGPLAQAARALLTGGAVPPEVAESILQDYEWAQRLRDPDQRHLPPHHSRRRLTRTPSPDSASTVQPLVAPRVALCNRAVEQPWGHVTLRCVSMSADALTVDVVIRWPTRPGGSHRHSRRFGPPGGSSHPGTITVTDDRGNSVRAGFSGGGGEEEWTGEFRAHPGPLGSLAADTAYVDILGERIEMPTAPGSSTVRLEPVDHGSAVTAALWSGLAGPFPRHGFSDPEPAIDAFVTCGLLAADDPVIDQVRTVTAALGFGQPVQRFPPGPPGATQMAGGGTVPEPWATLVAQQSRPPAAGPSGMVAVATATPVFDNMSVAVSVLTSDPGDVRISIVLVGGWQPLAVSDPESPQVAWWARDDRGGVYLGEWHGSSSDGHRVTGEIGFGRPLDPRATRLDLMPTGPTTRAVIEVPLPWETGAAGDPTGGSDG